MWIETQDGDLFFVDNICRRVYSFPEDLGVNTNVYEIYTTKYINSDISNNNIIKIVLGNYSNKTQANKVSEEILIGIKNKEHFYSMPEKEEDK